MKYYQKVKNLKTNERQFIHRCGFRWNTISPGRRAVLTLPLCQRFFGLSFLFLKKQPIFFILLWLYDFTYRTVVLWYFYKIFKTKIFSMKLLYFLLYMTKSVKKTNMLRCLQNDDVDLHLVQWQNILPLYKVKFKEYMECSNIFHVSTSRHT